MRWYREILQINSMYGVGSTERNVKMVVEIRKTIVSAIVSEKYKLIKTHASWHSVGKMCKLLEVSRNGQYYQKYPDGFYVYADTKMKKTKISAQYIERYLPRPAMAEYRILDLTEETIHYCYVDYKTNQ